jgi:hypothetical protein
MFNITISNVPGPEKPLYFRGAELLSIFPASIVTHGQALNITCHSYAGQMNFGFTGCHTSVPSLQRLAVYSADALAELEAALLPAPPAPAPAPARAAPAAAEKKAAAKRAPRSQRVETAPAKAPARKRSTKAAAAAGDHQPGGSR